MPYSDYTGFFGNWSGNTISFEFTECTGRSLALFSFCIHPQVEKTYVVVWQSTFFSTWLNFVLSVLFQSYKICLILYAKALLSQGLRSYLFWDEYSNPLFITAHPLQSHRGVEPFPESITGLTYIDKLPHTLHPHTFACIITSEPHVNLPALTVKESQ